MKVYVASNMPTDYPRKLQKPSTVNDRVRETAESFIMDSGIGDDVTNEEVLDLAEEYNADYVVAKDYLHDFERTTESTIDFLGLHAEHPTDATPMIPLQCDPKRNKWHAQHLHDAPKPSDHFVLGGMAVDEVSTEQQIRAIKEFRKTVGSEPYVHALGVGGSMAFVEAVAGKGWVDSIDCATPEMAGQFGCIMDKRLRQKEVRVMSGDNASARNIPLSEFNSWQLQDVWDREAEHTGLAAYE